jgi:hypothetical protein
MCRVKSHIGMWMQSRHPFLPHAFPFEFFDEALQFLVIVHRLPGYAIPKNGAVPLF